MKRKKQNFKRDTIYWSLFCLAVFLLGTVFLLVCVYRNQTLPDRSELRQIEAPLVSVNERWSYTSGTWYELQDSNGTEYSIPGYMTFAGTDPSYEKGRILSKALQDKESFTLLLEQRAGKSPIVWEISVCGQEIMTYEDAKSGEIHNHHLGYILGAIFMAVALCMEVLWCVLETSRRKRQQRARQRRLEAKNRRNRRNDKEEYKSESQHNHPKK